MRKRNMKIRDTRSTVTLIYRAAVKTEPPPPPIYVDSPTFPSPSRKRVPDGSISCQESHYPGVHLPGLTSIYWLMQSASHLPPSS